MLSEFRQNTQHGISDLTGLQQLNEGGHVVRN